MSNKTLYEYCVEANIRPLNLHKDDEDKFFTVPVESSEFEAFVLAHKIKSNSMPRKPEKYLELRMYGLVPYNISDIQKGIQFDHACKEYTVLHGSDADYINYLKEWKTDIILNGGTSNEGTMVRHGFKDVWYVGTMQQHLKTLLENGVKVATFYEPDLNSMLTSVVFLVDERVFNKTLYPDFKSSPYPWSDKSKKYRPTTKEKAAWEVEDKQNYSAWLEKIGGDKNAFLREFLANFRLA